MTTRGAGTNNTVRNDTDRPLSQGDGLPVIKALTSTVRVQKTLDALFAGWKTSANGESGEFSPGYRVSVSVLKNRQLMGCLLTNPPQRGGEVTLSRTVTVPPGDPKLSFVVANLPKGGEFGLRVRVDGVAVLSTTVSYPWADEVANGYARAFEVSLQPRVGRTVRLELVDASLGGERNGACWHDIRLTSGSGTFTDGVAVPLNGSETNDKKRK